MIKEQKDEKGLEQKLTGEVTEEELITRWKRINLLNDFYDTCSSYGTLAKELSIAQKLELLRTWGRVQVPVDVLYTQENLETYEKAYHQAHEQEKQKRREKNRPRLISEVHYTFGLIK